MRTRGRSLSLRGREYAGIGPSLVFSPLSRAPALWLDASDASTRYQDSALTTLALLDGDPVGGWKDKSGNGRHCTQATAAARPALKLAVQNGLPIIRSDGVDDQLRTAAFSYPQPATIFIVLATPSPGFSYWYSSLTGFGLAAYRVGSVGTSNMTMYAGAGGPQSNDWAVNVFQQLTSEYNGPNANLWRNGALENNGSGTDVGTQSGSGLVLFNRYDSTLPLAGDMAEVLIYPSLLAMGDRVTVQNYLKAKWGTP